MPSLYHSYYQKPFDLYYHSNSVTRLQPTEELTGRNITTANSLFGHNTLHYRAVKTLSTTSSPTTPHYQLVKKTQSLYFTYHTTLSSGENTVNHCTSLNNTNHTTLYLERAHYCLRQATDYSLTFLKF